MSLLPFPPDDSSGDSKPAVRELAPGAYLLPEFAAESGLEEEIDKLTVAAPFRHMRTRGRHTMSVAMTNCGQFGWFTDPSGYRYEDHDPDSGRPWPDMPGGWLEFASRAARMVGFEDFAPDSCLINRYARGARMALHQDQDERDFSQPIVSVSLGLPAKFLFGGEARSDPTDKIQLEHGDVVVWGGPARLRFHGVAPLKAGTHPTLGEYRFNLTFRRAR